jgi:hypothetical protein
MPFFKLKLCNDFKNDTCSGLIIGGSFPETLLLTITYRKSQTSPFEPEGQTMSFTGPMLCIEAQSEITYSSKIQRGRTKLDSVHILDLPEAQNEVPPRSRGRSGLVHMIPAQENILYSIKLYKIV